MKKSNFLNVPNQVTENAAIYAKSAAHLKSLSLAIFKGNEKDIDYNTLPTQDAKDKIQGWVIGYETAAKIASKAEEIKELCEVEINSISAAGENTLVVWALGNTFPIKDKLKSLGFKYGMKWNYRIEL